MTGLVLPLRLPLTIWRTAIYHRARTLWIRLMTVPVAQYADHGLVNGRGGGVGDHVYAELPLVASGPRIDYEHSRML